MSGFKEHDIVVCINNEYAESLLSMNKKYTVIYKYEKINSIEIIDDTMNQCNFNTKRFLLLNEYEILHRNDKINKLYGIHDMHK